MFDEHFVAQRTKKMYHTRILLEGVEWIKQHVLILWYCK